MFMHTANRHHFPHSPHLHTYISTSLNYSFRQQHFRAPLTTPLSSESTSTRYLATPSPTSRRRSCCNSWRGKECVDVCSVSHSHSHSHHHHHVHTALAVPRCLPNSLPAFHSLYQQHSINNISPQALRRLLRSERLQAASEGLPGQNQGVRMRG
jgi:hypothetical protein